MSQQDAVFALDRLAVNRILSATRHGGFFRRGRRVLSVRQKVRLEIETAYRRGYNDGHEEQMQARIRDATERRGEKP